METGTGKQTDRYWHLALLWVFLAALALRMLWLSQYQNSPFFNAPSLDFSFFDLRAREILRGKWFSDSYLFNPLYPLYLAAVYPVFGYDLFYPRLIQALLGASSTLLVYAIAAWTFNKRSGLIAAVLVALYLPLIYYDGILMATSLLTFLVLLSVRIMLRAVDSPHRRSALPLFAASGLVSGLVLLGRPNFLLVAAALAAWLILNRSLPSRGIRMAGALAFMAAALLVISPITVHHKIEQDEWVVVAPHGGFNFYIGNHPEATGAFMSIPGISDLPGRQVEDSRRAAAEALQRPVSSAEASDYWMNRSRSFIRSEPLAYLRLLARKVALFWNFFEIPSEYGIDFDSRFHPFLRWPLIRFGWLAPLGLTGIVLAVAAGGKTRSRAVVPGLVVLAMMAAVIAFFVHARYRMAVTPWVAMFAGFALSEMIRFASDRHWKPLILCWLLLPVTAGFVHMKLTERNDLPGFYNLGHAYLHAGNLAAAEDCFREILSRDNSMKTWLSLGSLQLQTGRLAEAETSFRNVLAQDESHYDALLNLAMICSAAGRYPEAEKLLETAFRHHPDRVEARVNLAIARLELKQYDEAAALIDGVEPDAAHPDIMQAVRQIRERLTLETGPDAMQKTQKTELEEE